MLFGGVLCSANLAAQQIDSSFADIDYIKKNNAWSTSSNAVGLKYYTLQKISRAKAYVEKANGDFKNYHQSDNSYKYGIDAQSIFRLSPNTIVSGNILYQSFKGKNMGGSSFIDPYLNSFDIVELDDANKGVKTQESYNLGASISSQLNHKLTIGGAVDYNAGNFAKSKDLRHINKLLAIDLSIGASYLITPSFEIGANYQYQRRIESIYFNTYGNRTDVPYSSLISFGTFYGKLETFGKNDFTEQDKTTPFTNNAHGGALQLNFHVNPKLNWFSELTYRHLKGAFGVAGSNAMPLTDHNGTQYEFKTQLSFIGNRLQHIIGIDANYATLTNIENEAVKQTSSGVTRILYYARKERLDKQQLLASFYYTLFKDVVNNNPKWEFNFTADFFRRQQTTSMSPFYRDQTINSYQGKANVKRNLVKANKMYSFALGLGYGSGDGLAKRDGFYFDPSASQVPQSNDLYLYQEFEYFTKPRVMVDISLQYTKKIKANVAPFAKLSYNYTKAFDTQFLGGSFGVAGLSVGCNF